MEAVRFDDLTRTISRLATRRGALRLLSGAVAALGLGASGQPGMARVCRTVGDRCGKGIKGHCCPGAVCRRGKKGRGRCVCRPGLTQCGDHCFDGPNDPRGCGPKCEVCPEETDCCNGACCPAGQRCCGGVCTDLTSDNANCGGCTQECPAGLTCCDSRCRLFTDDPRHCGTCGHACRRGEICANGQCVCRPGYADCGEGFCRDLQSDVRNCGACQAPCGSMQVCQAGQCVCQPGTQICDEAEPSNCGHADSAICTSNQECCTGGCDEGRCYPCRGQLCIRPEHTCCAGFECELRPEDDLKFCGGCAGSDQPCFTNADCCFSDCNEVGRFRLCLSRAGGPCARNRDCLACEEEGNCTNACVDGRCRV